MIIGGPRQGLAVPIKANQEPDNDRGRWTPLASPMGARRPDRFLHHAGTRSSAGCPPDVRTDWVDNGFLWPRSKVCRKTLQVCGTSPGRVEIAKFENDGINLGRYFFSDSLRPAGQFASRARTLRRKGCPRQTAAGKYPRHQETALRTSNYCGVSEFRLASVATVGGQNPTHADAAQRWVARGAAEFCYRSDSW